MNKKLLFLVGTRQNLKITYKINSLFKKPIIKETDEWIIRKDGEMFIIEGKAINRLMGRINIDDNESMYYFHKRLKELGIDVSSVYIDEEEGSGGILIYNTSPGDDSGMGGLVDTVYNEINDDGDVEVFTYGPIIHNEEVVIW